MQFSEPMVWWVASLSGLWVVADWSFATNKLLLIFLKPYNLAVPTATFCSTDRCFSGSYAGVAVVFGNAYV